LAFIEHGADESDPSLVAALRQAVDERPVVMHPGDCLFPGAISRLWACFRDQSLDAAILVNPADRQPGRMSLVDVDTPNQFRSSRPQGVALILGPSVWPRLDAFSRGGLSVPLLTDSLGTAGYRVGTCEVGEHWCFANCADRLLSANRMLLDALPFELGPATVGVDCKAQGRVSVSPSAEVCRSTLRGPVLIGDDAVVEDSFVGPYTAVGPRARVVGAEIDYTMVLADAEVRYPGYRLEGSVIGERAVVKQSFSLPAGMHLRIGPGAHVTLG
jgi:glucose-1-phosphate thymidylyltransferase